MLRMHLPAAATPLILVVALALTGCKSVPTPGEYSTPVKSPAAASSGPHHAGSHNGAQPGVFDFYLLNLSWSTEFCATHGGSPECAARPGFVVHGLWPQDTDGTYPENCDDPALPTNPAAYLDLLPTVQLIEHEWAAHGTCSGLAPDAYFGDVRTALQKIEIPPSFAAAATPPTHLTPQALLQQFSSANPSFPHNSFVLTCGNNYLTAVEACFDKNLNPIACQGVRSCRANSIKITAP
jgi:ribonuclease T2